MRTGPDAALKQYAETHFGDLSDVEGMAETLYNAGFRDSITVQIQFQDLPAQMRRIEEYVRKICQIFEEHGVITCNVDPLRPARPDRETEIGAGHRWQT